ncbi:MULTISPECIES: hypothetical protein [Legionella]|uniref:Uncharacterized protein n=1 Tax=Legionella drozanskii LLAP-1 TaxID=1212489 RepID=A0A0W0TBU0_9GAMM|nr:MULTISPECIES: hypothetical protein [Legionella]KTC93035.1 hypothetical protein Ldro_0406 [Legionella drozanskii LLAP-1]PJE11940.1 MAG: hypothetical protein CK430_08200 [Legionella sp.]
MNNNKTEKTLYFTLILFISLAFLGAPAFPQANPTQLSTISSAKNTEIAYFRVYRLKPGWWYGPRPNRNAWSGPVCTRRCIVNQYGTVLRCKTGCY